MMDINPDLSSHVETVVGLQTERFVEILEFRHFESFFRFDQSDRTGEISIGSYQFSIYKIYWGKYDK